MDSTSIALLAAILVLIAFSAYFSATETAFTSLNRIRLRTRADAGDRKAEKVLALAEQYDRLLSTILIGNNIVNITATTLSTVLFSRLCGGQLGPTVSTVVLTVAILVFGEISPKSLAKEAPERWAYFAAPLLHLFMVVLTPLNFLFSCWKKFLNHFFRRGQAQGITEEELVGMVNQAEDEGGLDEHEGDLIRNAIGFSDLTAEDILTPRVEIVAVDEGCTMEELAAQFAGSGYSRIPMYRESVDDIIGLIHEKDFYAARARGETSPAKLLTPVIYTTGTATLPVLLRILQKNKVHMAIVVDEYGGTEGLLTLENILERLVGEIWDEHDEVVEFFRRQEDGSWLVDCSADLDRLYDLFGLKDACEAVTVSGWVLERLGRLPQEGEQFSAEGLDVTVTRVAQRRIMEIRVCKQEAPVPEA